MDNNKLNDLVNSLNLQELSSRKELAEMPSASEPTLEDQTITIFAWNIPI